MKTILQITLLVCVFNSTAQKFAGKIFTFKRGQIDCEISRDSNDCFDLLFLDDTRFAEVHRFGNLMGLSGGSYSIQSGKIVLNHIQRTLSYGKEDQLGMPHHFRKKFRTVYYEELLFKDNCENGTLILRDKDLTDFKVGIPSISLNPEKNIRDLLKSYEWKMLHNNIPDDTIAITASNNWISVEGLGLNMPDEKSTFEDFLKDEITDRIKAGSQELIFAINIKEDTNKSAVEALEGYIRSIMVKGVFLYSSFK